jgi:ubiquinone/menaquinone biosynthesis C-methylase UbiE
VVQKDVVGFYKKLLDECGIVPSSILHLGCSAGFKLAHLRAAYPQARLCGIDPGEESIKHARERVKGVEFKTGFAHKIDYPDQAFDVTVLPMVLQWIPRRYLLASLAEIDRVTARAIVLSEFLPDEPLQSVSHHNEQVKIFKQDYVQLFHVLPWWSLEVTEMRGEDEGEHHRWITAVFVRKTLGDAYKTVESVKARE